MLLPQAACLILQYEELVLQKLVLVLSFAVSPSANHM